MVVGEIATSAWTGSASRGIALVAGVLSSVVLIAVAVLIVSRSMEMSGGGAVVIGFLVVGAIWLPIFQWLDAKRRLHVLSADSVVYRRGIFCSYEIEIPYRHVHAVAVQQNVVQRLFGCGDVRLTTHGVVPATGLVTSADMNSLVLRSIPDHAKVGEVLRERMRAHATEPRQL